MPRCAPRPWLVGAALLAAAAGTSCRRAGSGPPPERYLPATAPAAVVVPELRRAARELATLDATLSAFPGAGQQLAGLRRALTAQLGLDALDAAELARAGLEPARGAALGYEPPAEPEAPPTAMLILPVRDARALEALVARLARERLGAPERSASEQGGLQLVTFRARADALPALTLGLLSSERTALLAPGPTGPAAVRRAVARAAAESLAAFPAWRDLRGALGDRYALLAASIPSAQRDLERDDVRWPRNLFPAGLAVGFSAEAGSLRLALAARPSASTLQALRAGVASRTTVRALSPESALVLRWDGDLGELGRHVVARTSPRDREWLAAHGFDLQRDLFDQLAPGAAASVSISPRLDLTDVSDVALRADPLRAIRFELAGDVKDEASARGALARLPALFAALAGGASPAAPAGSSGRITTPSGEIAWRLAGKRLAIAGGPPGALDALVARRDGSAQGFAAPTEPARTALEGGVGGAVLAPRNLVASVRALPEDAFGTGPTGFVVRSMVERFLEPAERISAVSARVEITSSALRVDVQVEVPPPPSAEAGR